MSKVFSGNFGEGGGYVLFEVLKGGWMGGGGE